jgi:hypothetical protein
MKFECPACTQHLDGESAYVGRPITCPACGHAFVVPRPVVAAAATACLLETPTAAPTARPAFPLPVAGRSSKMSKLAIASLALSMGSLLLGPFGSIPGIVCGHLAKANLRRNAMLRGARFATAGLAIGYLFLILMVAGGVILLKYTGSLTRQVLQSVSPVGTNDYSVIDMQNPMIPSQPAAGPVNGSIFYVRRAKIEGSDLVLIGDSSKDVPEIRLHPDTGAQTRFQFNILPLVQNAANFKVATQLQPNGTLGKSCTVTLRTADGITDMTSDAGIRLVFHAPRNGVCKTAMHLAFGSSRKEYVLGEFVTELSPELIRRVQDHKP